MKKNLKLFWIMFHSSIFIIGAGIVALPIFRKRFVEELKWVGEEEMLDLVTIAEAVPGAFVVNLSLLVGHRVSGMTGAAVALIGSCLPPLILLSVLQGVYAAVIASPLVANLFRGLNAGVAAVMLDLVFQLGKEATASRKLYSYGFIAVIILCIVGLNISAAIVILVCIALGTAVSLAGIRKERKRS